MLSDFLNAEFALTHMEITVVALVALAAVAVIYITASRDFN